MIVRERENSFVMIEQHHHATISGKLFDGIKEELSEAYKNHKKSIHLAVYLHDVGWAPFDASPIWQDDKIRPYDFITLPNTIKSVLYKNGVDKVEQESAYAALLCSHHYVQFLQKASDLYSKQFIQTETEREKKLIHQLNTIDKEKFLAHYELLKFFDNLSLYICLHEKNPSEEDIHFFFKNGIQLPSLYGEGIVNINWQDNKIALDKSILAKPITIVLQQKNVTKTAIDEIGILSAWQSAPYEEVQLTVE